MLKFNKKPPPDKTKQPDPAAIMNAMTAEVFAVESIQCEAERSKRFNEIEKRYKPQLPAGAATRLVNIARTGTGTR